jgi:hypothetical protein
MTTAPDTPQERMAEYGRLFEHALAGRERTTDAVIWRFTARAGVEAWVRDLADREAACCPFFVYTVSEQDGQVTYQIAGDDDPIVHGILDEFHHLPERLADGLPGLLQRLHDHGLEVRARDDGSAMTATERSGSNSPSVRNRSPATVQ